MSKVYRKPIRNAALPSSIKHPGARILDNMRRPRNRAGKCSRRR